MNVYVPVIFGVKVNTSYLTTFEKVPQEDALVAELLTVKFIVGSLVVKVPEIFNSVLYCGASPRLSVEDPAGAVTEALGLTAAPSATQLEVMVMLAALMLKKTFPLAFTITLPLVVVAEGITML